MCKLPCDISISPFQGKKKAKGLKEKTQNLSSSQAKEKRKGKRAPFVVGEADFEVPLF